MKKISILFIAVGFIIASCVLASAADKKAPPKESPVKSKQTLPVLTDKQVADIAQKTSDTLNSKKWALYLNPTGGRSGKPQPEILTFTGNTVSSQYFAAKGFKPSNFATHVQPDQSSVLETLQRDGAGGMAAWRIVVANGSPRGTVTAWDKQGAVIDAFYITGAPVTAPTAPTTPSMTMTAPSTNTTTPITSKRTKTY